MLIEPNGAGSPKNPAADDISTRENRNGADDDEGDGVDLVRMSRIYCGKTCHQNCKGVRKVKHVETLFDVMRRLVVWHVCRDRELESDSS